MGGVMEEVVEALRAGHWSWVAGPEGGEPAWPREDALGLAWHDLLHPADREGFLASWAGAIAAGTSWLAEVRLQVSPSAFRWFQVRGTPVRAVGGAVQRWRGIVTEVDAYKVTEARLTREAGRLRREQQEQWALFRAYMDHSPVVAFIKDDQGRTVFANRERARLFGLSSVEEMLGRYDREFMPPELVQVVAENDRAVWLSGEPLRVIEGPPATMGEATHWLVSKFLFPGPSGTLLGGLGVDVTEQYRMAQQLHASEERFRKLFELAPVGIVQADPEGGGVVGNRHFQELVGYSAGELATMSYVELVAPEEVAGIRRAIGEQHPTRMGERHLRHRDGRLVPVLVAVGTVPDPETGVPNLLGTCLDLTELRRGETMKDEFLSVISHELRTPINAIMGMGSILMDEILGPLNPQQRECLATVLGGADRLLAHINDLLDISSMFAGRFRLYPERIDLAMLVGDVVEHLGPVVAERRQTLDRQVSTELPVLVADPQRIYQVLVKLLTNASKYTPEGGRLQVRAALTERWLRVEVEDDGIGIAPADQPQLFELFTQVDMSNTRRVGGIGLGLALVKALVEAHHGEVGVASAPGQGSVFWFTLPVSELG